MTLFAMLLWGMALGVTIWGTWYALRELSRPIPEVPDSDLPPVTILKPIKGCDSGLAENLESFLKLDYPVYEILFCIADPDDPACALVKTLLQKYPRVDAALKIGDVPVGPNPKINNIFVAYHEAKHDHVLISDSNVRVTPEYLKRLTPELSPEVGVVTSVVAGTRAAGVGGFLEAAYLNTFYARWMHISAFLGVPCVIGKSMLFRRSVATRFGGIRVLGRYINEDYMAGRAMLRLGHRVCLHPDPVNQFIGEHSFSDFWSRHIRWGRIRKSQAPAAFGSEPLVGMWVSGLVGAYGFHSAAGVSPWLFLTLHFAIWGICDLQLMRRLGAGQNLPMFLAWALREIVALPLWAHIASGNTVVWRGKRLTLGAGGVLTRATSRVSSPLRPLVSALGGK